jgi:hypothetical protein
MRKRGGAGKSEGKVSWPSSRLLYVFCWSLGFFMLGAYGWALYIERTAPINAVTGFHVSTAGAFVYLLYPVATVLQTILLLSGFWLMLMGMVGNRKWTLPGLGIFVLGAGFMLVNYLISQ